MDLAGELIESSLSFGLIEVEFGSGDRVEISVDRNAEFLDEAFNIWEDNIVPAGRCAGWGLSIAARTADKRPWSVNLALSRSEFFTGHNSGIETGFSLRPARGLDLRMSADVEQISFPGGGFTTRLLRGSVNYAMTTRHLFNLLGQYENDSNSFGCRFASAGFRNRTASFSWVICTTGWKWSMPSMVAGVGRIGRESAVKAGYSWWF